MKGVRVLDRGGDIGSGGLARIQPAQEAFRRRCACAAPRLRHRQGPSSRQLHRGTSQVATGPDRAGTPSTATGRRAVSWIGARRAPARRGGPEEGPDGTAFSMTWTTSPAFRQLRDHRQLPGNPSSARWASRSPCAPRPTSPPGPSACPTGSTRRRSAAPSCGAIRPSACTAPGSAATSARARCRSPTPRGYANPKVDDLFAAGHRRARRHREARSCTPSSSRSCRRTCRWPHARLVAPLVRRATNWNQRAEGIWGTTRPTTR